MSAPQKHGLLNIDKPAGMTSREVVNRVGRLAKKLKVGHAGTLDPLATGVLVVCLGAATRLVDRIQEHRKGYRAGLKLGVCSDTDDSTGTVTHGGDPAGISAVEIEAVLSEFQGDIAQVPPKFSAVHVEGQRAYDLARAELDFELTARTVRVESIRLAKFSAEGAELDIICGSGTYIRSIIRDLGERLGCGAIMTSLRRTFIGPFHDAEALPGDQLSLETLTSRLQPLITVLDDDPRLTATDFECQALLQGRGIAAPVEFHGDSGRQVAVIDPSGELFAFATFDAARCLILPQRVFMR